MIDPVLATVDLLASYVPQVDILNGVTITVAKNEIVTVVGPNGAGKSTLLKTLVGLLAPKAGRVTLESQDITGMQPSTIVRPGPRLCAAARECLRNAAVDENSLKSD